MKIYIWKSNNIGDGANVPIFQQLVENPEFMDCAYMRNFSHEVNDTYIVFGMGSILSACHHNSSKDIICGSGLISDQRQPIQPKHFISVRGPLTRKCFLDAGISCPSVYGDIGLLFRYFFPAPIAVSKKYKIGFIPHYIDANLPIIKEIKGNPDCTIIDINQALTPVKFVQEIHECDVILSSSLHGIIISDSYGIPAHHIVLSKNVVGGSFKFRDYYASVNRPYFHIDLSSLYTEQLLTQCKPYTVDFDFDSYYTYIQSSLQSIERGIIP